MRLIRLFLSVSLFLVAMAHLAVGQAVPTATGPGFSFTLGGGYSVYHLQYGERYLGGAQLWADDNLFRRVGIEAEARRLRQNQDLQTHADTYLAGPRFALRPRYGFQPYVKVLGGLGRFHFPYDYARGNYFVVAGGGGIDFHLSDRVQIRAIDVEYQQWPQFTFGSMNSFGVSAGLSIVLYRGPSWINE